MKQSILVFLTSACFLFFSENAGGQDVNTYQHLKQGFENPPPTARPKVYWWCLNGNIDTISAREELQEMKNAGITGFDFFEIGVPKGDTMIPAGPAFLSDASLKVIKFVVEEAGKLGLEMGLNLSSSWNAGGSWTLPKNAGKSLYHSKMNIEGGTGTQKIHVPFPEISFPKSSLIGGTGKSLVPFRSNGRPEYYEDVAILAIPVKTESSRYDTAEVINLTRFFNPQNDLLIWKAPSGKWQILRYVCSNSGQQLVLPSPHSAGLTIDHFDATAVRTHLMYIINRLQSVLGDFRKTALKSFYLASYEARGFVWTPTLPEEFRKINGYDIYKFLPSFYDTAFFSEEITASVQSDFKKTLSELMINNLYKEARKICNHYGLKINSEAGGPGFPLYNGPAEPLKALGSLDIPRGEFWVNHSRYYMDSNGKDSIDILRVVKEVAAASHIYKRGIVEEEAFTSFQHWQEGPFDLKPFGDRAFCEGMNRVVFHGFSHNPRGTGFPGIVYHAGTHFNTKRVWWPMAKPFITYLARNSFVFQNTRFFADVLYYYGDRVPNSATPKNTHFVVGPGYDYEVINTEILLNDLSVRNGKLVLSNGATFSMLALDKEDVINPFVLMKLKELADKGAVIIGVKPQGVKHVKNNPLANGNALINQIWKTVSDPSTFRIEKNGRIYDGIKPAEVLKALQLEPDLIYSDSRSWLLDFIHYNKNGLDFYFIRNTSDQWISRKCGFRQQSKIPELWNPVTGEIISVPMYKQQGKYIHIPVTLAPYGSCLVVFKKRQSTPIFTGVGGAADDNPPLMEFTNNGVVFLDEGIYNVAYQSETKRIENKPETRILNGDWQVTFTKGWGAPDSAVFPKLSSWTNHTNPGIKYYSGIATYTKTFRFDRTKSSSRKIYIDLGEIAKVAELWLNGRYLGITWAKPYRFDVTQIIKDGENQLTVKVANTWSNRLTGDALTGEPFTHSNIRSSTRGGLLWKDSPLLPSGLLGPVSIQSFEIISKIR